jgi:hypothetical protein
MVNRGLPDCELSRVLAIYWQVFVSKRGSLIDLRHLIRAKLALGVGWPYSALRLAIGEVYLGG